MSSPAKKRFFRAGFVHFVPLFVVALLIGGLVFFSSAKRTVSNVGRSILSESDDSDNSGSGSSGSGSDSDSSGSGSSGSDDDDDSSSSGSSGSDDKDEIKTETTLEDGTVIRTEVKDGEVRTETRFPSGIRVRTREEEGKRRVDIYQGATKLRLERRDGRLIIKLENEAGEEFELPEGAEEEIFKIEERDQEEQVRVRVAGEKFIISRGQLGALTDFPVSINLLTNELTITTPAGEKTVAVLPDAAVANMLAANIIDQVRGLSFTQELESAATNAKVTLSEIINLISTRDGILAYEIPGVSNKRFLGFIPVEVKKTIVVSAETGDVLDIEQSIGSLALDVFSF